MKTRNFLLIVLCLVLPMNARARQSVDDYIRSGNKKSGDRDWDGAISDYNKAIKLDPQFFPLYLNRAIIKQSKGDLDGASMDIEQAIRLEPASARAYVCRGAIKQDKHDSNGALADFNRAIELDPKDSTFYICRGSVKNFKGDLAGALADYNEGIKLEPKTANNYHDRGVVKRAVGDLDGALADFNKAVELDPGTAVFYRLRGGIKEAKGDLDGAIVDFRRALELKPTAQDYMRIGVWIARTKKGEKSAANDELAGYLGKRTPDADGDWPAKIARFLMGQISEADLLAEAKSSDAEKDKGRHCEFWYYAGMKQLFAGDKKSAADDFRKSVATQKKRFGEYWSAKSELKALGE